MPNWGTADRPTPLKYLLTASAHRGVTLDYLLGGSSAILDKDLLKRLEDIENLTKEDRDKIYYFIDMAVRDAKTRQAYGA